MKCSLKTKKIWQKFNMNKIITKWIEPYVLLETLKKDCKLVKDFTFDGFSKNEIKKEFLKQLEKENNFGLYMKNVNKFYLFNGNVDIDKIFELSPIDYEVTEDIEKPFEMVDMGKAEASIIKS